MHRTKTKPVADYSLTTGFETARRKLLQADFADRREKPLAYWVLTTDRRLPVPFLDRPLGELVNTPLAELLATSGIGVRKVQTLIMLLNRASQPFPPGASLPPDVAPPPGDSSVGSDVRGALGDIDAAIVSEALWVKWQATVSAHGLERETLGRLAPSLRSLTREMWHKPLSSYAEFSLAEIRGLKSYGEKRVNGVLEVFGGLHTILGQAGTRPHLVVRLRPPSVDALDAWVTHRLQASDSPTPAEVQEQFVRQLLRQVSLDANRQVTRFALRQMRMKSTSDTARRTARQMGVTTARVYQLRSEVAEIIAARWPAGRLLVGALGERLRAAGLQSGVLVLFDTACELFFAIHTDRASRVSSRASGASGPKTLAEAPDANRTTNGREPVRESDFDAALLPSSAANR